MTDLIRATAREKLKPLPNSAPYWDRLQPGLHLGYRPAADGLGTWIAKSNVKGKLEQKTLGAFGGFANTERYVQAKAAAEAFHGVRTGGGNAKGLKITVAEACREYAKKKPDTERFFQRHTYNDPIATITLEDLRRQDLIDWRKRLEERPVVYRRAGSSPDGQRALSSINREMTPLRAALYAKLPAGQPDTEAAWQEALTKIPPDEADRRRELYLEKQERQALLANVSDPFAEAFIRCLCLLPVRVGALAQLTVANLNTKFGGELSIPYGVDKTKKARKVPLSTVALALLTAQAKDKLPGALLFTRANGEAWDAETWQDPINAAVAAAKLPAETCATTLRHCVITDLCVSGTDILTVARMAGTSVEMIEKHYGQLRADVARAALQKLAL